MFTPTVNAHANHSVHWATKIGVVEQKVINLLSLNFVAGAPICISDQNIDHMKLQHPVDYGMYGEDIGLILAEPDFIGLKSDGSLEYIKEIDQYVKVAVRGTKRGWWYARTLFHVSDADVALWVKRNRLKEFF